MNKKTDNQTEELKKQAEEWKGKYLRALADYQNLERRVSEQYLEQRDRIIGEIMHSVLLFIDDVKRAERNSKEPEIKKGLEATIEHFNATLAYFHIKKIEVLHKQFNPQQMECIEALESDKDNEVLEEVRSGYLIRDKVLRVAQVKVGKKKEVLNN